MFLLPIQKILRYCEGLDSIKLVLAFTYQLSYMLVYSYTEREDAVESLAEWDGDGEADLVTAA